MGSNGQAPPISKFTGCMIGQALGNAISFPFEKFSRQRVRSAMASGVKEIEEHPSGLFSPGQYSDDTQVALAILESLVEKGKIDLEDVAFRITCLWERRELVAPDRNLATVFKNLREGLDPERSGTPEGIAGSGTARSISPIALFLHDNLQDLARGCQQLGRMLHQDARSTAGAVATAYAIAYNLGNSELNQEEFVELLSDIVAKLDREFARGIGRLPSWVAETDPEKAIREIAEFGDGQGPDEDRGFPDHVVSSVLVSLLAFLKTPSDFLQSIRFVISAHGAVDTTASITGAISGSAVGVEGVPENFARQIHDRGRKGFDYIRLLAEKLHHFKY